MDSAKRNDSVYVGLLALVWDSLEQLSERLDTSSRRPSEGAWPERLDDVRLELMLWKKASHLFALRTDLSVEHGASLMQLIKRLDGMLDLSAIDTAATLQNGIFSAQDAIYDEIQSTCVADDCVARGSAIQVSATVRVAYSA